MSRFEYKHVPVSAIQVELTPFSEAEKAETVAQGSQYLFHGGKLVTAVVIDGERIAPTERFWNSLYARFGMNRAFFRFFDHKEVFDRITQKEPDSTVRLCIDRKYTGNPKLLAATGLNKPVLLYDDLMDVLGRFNATEGIKCENGIVISTHTPRIGNTTFQIAGDKFTHKFELHSPIDGYGQPNIYLSLLRLICSNGMVGLANAFKTTLQLGSSGDDVRYTLGRVLDGFSNDEGFAMLRERFDIAARSWASLREQQDLYRLLLTIQNDVKSGEGGAKLLSTYEDITGRPIEIYKRDPNAFTTKRLRSLPVSCRVYDMINFATELATHKVSDASTIKLNAWVGGMISAEYDLEESCDQFDDFKSFFLRENREKFEQAKNARTAIDED